MFPPKYLQINRCAEKYHAPEHLLTSKYCQALQAYKYGLHALSITEDTVRTAAASQPRRDLFKEFAEQSGVAVAVMSPQMMGGDRANKLMRSKSSRRLVRWVLVDESVW